MNFFYCENYFDSIEGDEGKEKPLSMLKLHAEMYALGDKYQVPELSRLATQKYEGRLKRDWISQVFLRSIAKMYKLTSESNRELWNVTFRHARFNIEQFQSDDAMQIQFKETCLDVSEFAIDLDCSQCDRRQSVESTQLRCLKCGKSEARWEYEKDLWIWHLYMLCKLKLKTFIETRLRHETGLKLDLRETKLQRSQKTKNDVDEENMNKNKHQKEMRSEYYWWFWKR